MADSLHPLGRREPIDFTHIQRYPYSVLAPEVPLKVEKALPLPPWRKTHNQGQTSSCAGHGTAAERAITNRLQLSAELVPPLRYDPIDIWNQAKMIDDWPDTNPGDDNGTSVRACYDVARKIGIRRVKKMKVVDDVPTPVGEYARSKAAGVSATRWATTVDEVRAAIAADLPVTLGINWYSIFDSPIKHSDGSYWLPDSGKVKLGSIRGGHCICDFAASDKRQAVQWWNSWIPWPLVWVPYKTLERLLREHGEAALVTDR